MYSQCAISREGMLEPAPHSGTMLAGDRRSIAAAQYAAIGIQ